MTVDAQFGQTLLAVEPVETTSGAGLDERLAKHLDAFLMKD